MVAERIPPYGNEDKSRPVCFSYAQQGAKQIVKNCYSESQHYDYVAEPVCVAERGRMYCGQPQHYEARTDGKTNTLTSVEKDNRVAEPINAIEFDDDGRPIKAIGKDGKEITIYKVKDGKITIKGKQYPIKLKDGFYIIRKLTVSECKRLQTVPEWYEFPVSNSQAYKMLGNGWTVDVIAHILKEAENERNYSGYDD